jgi:hypothetical protein
VRLAIAPRKSSASAEIPDAFIENANKIVVADMAHLADLADLEKTGVFRGTGFPTSRKPGKKRVDPESLTGEMDRR